MTVLLTFGIAIMVEGLLGFAFTGIYRKATPGYANESFILDGLFIPEGDILFIPKGQLYAGLMSIVLLVGLWAFLRYSQTGYAIRADRAESRSAQRSWESTCVGCLRFPLGSPRLLPGPPAH